MMRVPAVLVACVLFLASACSNNAPLGCDSAAQCPAGHVCLDRKCTQVCQSDDDCVAGTHCDGEKELCVPGSRGADGEPVIESVAGTSSENCVDLSSNPIGACIGTAFAVSGVNLAGASWELVSSEGIGERIALAPVGQQQNNHVVVAPAQDLAEGTYLLVATNGAGTAQATLGLLRGEQGPQGVPGQDGLGGNLLLFDNSTNLTSSTAFAMDRMVVRLAAPTSGAPASLALSDPIINDLCLDDDGCTVTLGATGWVDPSTGRTMEAARMGPRCPVSMTLIGGKRHWTVGTSCIQWHATWGADGSGSPVWTGASGNPGFYAPYYSNAYGIDGVDDTVAGGAVDDRGHLLNFERACYFSETVPQTGGAPGALQADDTDGFYLIASTPAWGSDNYPPTDQWPPATSGRACVLIIED